LRPPGGENSRDAGVAVLARIIPKRSWPGKEKTLVYLDKIIELFSKAPRGELAMCKKRDRFVDCPGRIST
jgi:hypothetical protein